jgi:hypothetical protein
VNLGLAKDQHLSLNPSQISGGCGRLLCCLKYEHEFYVAARKRFPKEGKTITTARGPEKIVAVDIFRERVFLRSEEHGSRIIPLVALRDEVEARGDVLMTAEARSRLVGAETAVPSERSDGNGAPPVPASADGQPAEAGTSPAGAPTGRPNRRRRRRRRRGGPGGGEPGGSGDGGPG